MPGRDPGGVHSPEYGRTTIFGKVTRFVNDLLLSAPSIVIGLFVYALIVANTGKFSAFSGALALALLVIPIVIRTTENMLMLVPGTLREAAFALGAPKHVVITRVTLRAARSGVVTGVLLAVARIAGETAPLLFTSLSNQFWSVSMSEPIASLPVTIFQFAMSPFEDWQRLAWAGAVDHARRAWPEHHRSRGPALRKTQLIRVHHGKYRQSHYWARPDRVSQFQLLLRRFPRAEECEFRDGKHKVTAFIGPSGCGKSTLLRTINRMYDLYPHQRAEGEILLNGETSSTRRLT